MKRKKNHLNSEEKINKEKVKLNIQKIKKMNRGRVLNSVWTLKIITHHW